jgi:hypothetical protein
MAWIFRARERAQMNARPEANTQYSRAYGPFWRLSRPLVGRAGGLSPAILGGAVIGALLLIVAEFTKLYELHEVTSNAAVGSMSTGAHDSYALIPIALLAAILGAVAVRRSSRAALTALAALGVLALAIALVGDLPDASAHGLTTQWVLAATTPGPGLYLETLGAIVLVITGGAGLLAGGARDALRGRGRKRRSKTGAP